MKRIIYILFVFSGFIPSLLVPGVKAAGIPVTTTGIGFVDQGNIANARDRAIADAKLRAIEQVCGTDVDSKTVIHKTLLISSTLMTRSKGAVREFKVISESLDEKNQLYSVSIQAVVDKETLEHELLKRAGEKKTLFMREKSQEKDGYLARELAKIFGNAGFSISQVFAAKEEFDILNPGTAVEILKKTEKDILIVFKMDNRKVQCHTSNFCTALVKGFIQLYAPFNLKEQDSLMVDEKFDKVKGFGNTKLTAKENALSQLNKELVYAFMGRLEKSMEKTVKIEVKNIPDFGEFKNLKRTIESFRWVMDVKEDSVGFHPVKSVFLVRYKNDLDFLSRMLDKLGKYKFYGRNTDRYTLEYNRHGRSASGNRTQ